MYVICVILKKKVRRIITAAGVGQLQCLDLFPQRQQNYWRYTAIISLCHTPGRTRGDSNTDRQFIDYYKIRE